MPLLNPDLNTPDSWRELQEDNSRRAEVDLAEVERVLELARRTPGLARYESALRKLPVFFTAATQFYRQQNPQGLADLVAFWERYRAVVTQRYCGVTPVELRAADTVVENVFDRFLARVPNERLAYDPETHPLVYGGEGGLGGYFTHPPGWNRPFAIINLPHAAFDNVWQWLALPHEVGHDTYATVEGLAVELETALAERMRRAVDDGDVTIPNVDTDLSVLGVQGKISYSGRDFLARVWTAWANESQADIVGLLSCGGAAPVALQQIIGFSSRDHWSIDVDAAGRLEDDRPEEHPTSYVRNALNVAALRRLDNGSQGAFADELQQRFEALRGSASEIVWTLGRGFEVARVPAGEMVKSAEIAAEVLVDHPLTALGSTSYAGIATFDAADQELVEQTADLLAKGDPTFAQTDGVEPRHCLAATVLAFEKNRQLAGVINETFLHFL